MPALHKNRVKMTVSGTPGTGTVTLNAASSGHQSFATAYGANATVDVLFEDGTAWEVARNCTYTHSGTTVTRGTLEESSTGSAISLTSAATASVIATAGNGNLIEALLQGVTPGGRLTLESGVPISTTDQTAKTSVYYTPYVHNMIVLWDGADWCPTTFTEKTLALGTLTSAKPYDVFGYLSSGALVLELLAWTNDTTRATAITLQDGRYCKSGDKTRLYLGSFYTTSTTTTADAVATRYLWNMYNRRRRQLITKDATTSWTYATNSWRQARATSSNKIELINGISDAILDVTVACVASGTGVSGQVGIGVNSTTTNSPDAHGSQSIAVVSASTAGFGLSVTRLLATPTIGYSYFAWLEQPSSGLTATFYGSGAGEGYTAGIMGSWSC
jgi:hypothetical protein